MLVVKSYQLNKTAALPADISLPLDGKEEQIFSFIRRAIGSMPKAPVARVAGGWVRDKLLGKPSKDIDITVEGTTGVEFANALRQYAIETQGTKQNIVSRVKDTEARPEQIKNLAVAFLRIFDQDMEILDLRAIEFYEKGNRNPTVIRLEELKAIAQQQGIPSFVKDKAPHLLSAISKLPHGNSNHPNEVLKTLDAHRRDLTINSLFYNINTTEIEDFTGEGYDDLLTMTLRTPIEPVKTFQDDPLRVLRILRFHSRYPNSKIAPEIIQAMADEEVQHQITRRLIKADETAGIVPERTAEELRKLMMGAQPEAALRVMHETGLLQKMFNLPKEFHPLNMDQMSSYHSLSVIEHILNVVKNVNNLAQEFNLSGQERMFLNLASLFHDLGKLDPRSHKAKPDGTRGYSGSEADDSLTHEQSSSDMWERFARALRLSDKERTTIQDVVSGHMRPHAHFENEMQSASDRTLRRYMRKNPLWKLQYILAMGDAMSKADEPEPQAADPYRATYEYMQSPGFTPPPKSTERPLVDGHRIIELVGAHPKSGYIEDVKEEINRLRDENPALTIQEAEQFILQMKADGAFAHLPPLR
jgi:tRNA nucleotidyltransferase/poly(A) polymerase